MTLKTFTSGLLAALVWAFSSYVACAQSVTETLTAASKLNEKGDYAAAIEKINEAFKSSALESATAAKAFLMRGEANEKLKRPAFALADYTNAVFMQSLSTSDRARAVDGRKRALASLGMAADDGGAKPLTSAASAEESKPSSSGGLFGNWFGGSSATAEVKPQTATDAQPSTWAQGTRAVPANAAPAASPAPPVRQVSPPPATSPAPLRQTAAATPAPDGKQFKVMLASVDTAAAAQGEAQRLSRMLEGELDGRKLEVVRFESNGVVFFRVVAGPYAGEAATKAVCDGVKAKNVTCRPITHNPG
jgi:hypothetical protein